MADSYGRINSAGAYSIGAATPVKVPTTDATKRHGIRVQNTSPTSYLYAVVVPGVTPRRRLRRWSRKGSTPPTSRHRLHGKTDAARVVTFTCCPIAGRWWHSCRRS